MKSPIPLPLRFRGNRISPENLADYKATLCWSLRFHLFLPSIDLHALFLTKPNDSGPNTPTRIMPYWSRINFPAHMHPTGWRSVSSPKRIPDQMHPTDNIIFRTICTHFLNWPDSFRLPGVLYRCCENHCTSVIRICCMHVTIYSFTPFLSPSCFLRD